MSFTDVLQSFFGGQNVASMFLSSLENTAHSWWQLNNILHRDPEANKYYLPLPQITVRIFSNIHMDKITYNHTDVQSNKDGIIIYKTTFHMCNIKALIITSVIDSRCRFKLQLQKLVMNYCPALPLLSESNVLLLSEDFNRNLPDSSKTPRMPVEC